MAYSTNLKIELIDTGAQAGTWGTTTNTNLGTALEQAIVGSVNIAFSSADVTLTLNNSNAAQDARALRLNLTGTSGGARNLYLGSGCQINKLYIVNNGLADAVTVQNYITGSPSGTSVSVPAGKTMLVYNTSANIVDAVTHLTSLTLGSALAATSGGTGNSSYTVGDILYASTTTALSTLAGVATGNALISGGVGAAPSYGKIGLTTHVNGTLPSANGGTGLTSFTSGGAVYATSTSALTTGTLPVASGGTGQTTLTANNVLLGNGTSAIQSVAPGTSGNLLTSNGTTWQSTALTATTVSNAYAGLTAGNVGTVMMGKWSGTSGTIAFGDTVSGSALTPANAAGDSSGSAQSGTWRCLGFADGDAKSGQDAKVTLWIRTI